MAVFEEQSLMSQTWRLLKYRGQTLAEIQAGTGIPHYWLRKFLGREIKDPSVNRVQKLYEYLTGKALKV